MKVVTAEMMRSLDRRAIDEYGIPGVVLMENAGRSVFEYLRERFHPLSTRRFHVFCGTGNNGGDGFVVARYLTLAGAQVYVTLVGDLEKVRGDARVHFELMVRLGIELKQLEATHSIQIDALLGTGIEGPPRAEYAEAIRCINSSPQPTISVDIPSGVSSDTGQAPGEAVCATATITFGYPKLGMFLSPGADLVGELIVCDIGFPWHVLNGDIPYDWLRPDELPPFPARPRAAHKGMFGHVLVVGGSIGMSGAVTMTAKAALRSGAGLVTVATPASAQPLVASKLDEAMTLPLPEKKGALCAESFELVREMAERCDVICLGPGATREPETQSVIARLLQHVDRPVVVDADGLNALAAHPDSVRERTAPTILTPHPGECARLLGTTAEAVQSDRIGAVRETAARYRSIVVLKGARSLIADGRSSSNSHAEEATLPICINTTGNPGMATGGSGDSLTGILGALIGQQVDAFQAACLGVYLHGRAGDFAAEAKGETALIAGDIIEMLPRAIQELEARQR